MKSIALAGALCVALPAIAEYQVRSVPVKIAPFYAASEHRADPPRVATNSGFDRLLSSTRREDVAKVHRAVMADYPDLSNYQVYACGNPLMVEAARRDFIGRCGLPETEFFSDAFTPASAPPPAPAAH